MQHRKTRVAWDEVGEAHFLTFSCLDRLPLLCSDWIRACFLTNLDSVRKSQNFAVWAYVIMPEHVHLLVYPRCETCRMKAILGAIKRPVSEAAHQRLLAVGATRWLHRLSSPDGFHFWQPGGGYDRNIREWASIEPLMIYIHENPVRRGLVDRVEDWRWSSARFWIQEESVDFVPDDPLGDAQER